MSVARGSQNGGHYYSNIVMPQEVDVQFTVTATNGLGITSLKSNGWVERLFMHTSTTPTATNGVTNPNPASGIVLLQLKQNFNVFLGFSASFQSPQSGGAVTTTVANTTYIVRALGTTTTAQWVAVGLPVGFTPAVGQVFTAIASQAIGGTGSVSAVGTSTVAAVEVIGDPNQMIANTNIASYNGAYLGFQLLDYAGALVAPTASSVCNMRLFFDRSSVSIDGL